MITFLILIINVILFIFVKVAQEYPEVALEEEVAEYVLPDVEVPHHFPPAPPQVMINLEVSRIPLHAISAGRG